MYWPYWTAIKFYVLIFCNPAALNILCIEYKYTSHQSNPSRCFFSFIIIICSFFMHNFSIQSAWEKLMCNIMYTHIASYLPKPTKKSLFPFSCWKQVFFYLFSTFFLVKIWIFCTYFLTIAFVYFDWNVCCSVLLFTTSCWNEISD